VSPFRRRDEDNFSEAIVGTCEEFGGVEVLDLEGTGLPESFYFLERWHLESLYSREKYSQTVLTERQEVEMEELTLSMSSRRDVKRKATSARISTLRISPTSFLH
jgi:hypothetical protein